MHGGDWGYCPNTKSTVIIVKGIKSILRQGWHQYLVVIILAMLLAFDYIPNFQGAISHIKGAIH